MDKRIHKKDEKVIFYPGLVKRLIEKGMDALKEKDGEKAYQLFVSAEEHEPDHPQVLFGKMLSLVELGRLEEAVEHTSQLLYEGIGDYYDNLQVHISLLVQLGKYEQVVEMITAVLSENRIPANHAESFYQLLHFSRQMVRSDDDFVVEPGTVHFTELEDMLQSTSLETQLAAITQLKENHHDQATSLLVAYIEREDIDLVLKSMAIGALQERNYDSWVQIEKLNRKLVAKPSELEDLSQTTFGTKVIQKLTEQLENENPLLLDFAVQICRAHLLALYPFLPEPEKEAFWAAVFHYLAATRLGMEDEAKKIVTNYGVSAHQLTEKQVEVEDLESKVFQVNHFLQ